MDASSIISNTTTHVKPVCIHARHAMPSQLVSLAIVQPTIESKTEVPMSATANLYGTTTLWIECASGAWHSATHAPTQPHAPPVMRTDSEDSPPQTSVPASTNTLTSTDSVKVVSITAKHAQASQPAQPATAQLSEN